MEIFLFARFHARPGNEGAVQAAIGEVLGPSREEPGCLSIEAFHAVRDPQEFYIHSCWRDMAAFERHVGLPHTLRFSGAVEPLLDHPLKVALTEQIG